MGHERVGILPKSARWTRLVHQMGGVFASEVPVGALAAQTLQNVRKRYETLFQDCPPTASAGAPAKAEASRAGHFWLRLNTMGGAKGVCPPSLLDKPGAMAGSPRLARASSGTGVPAEAKGPAEWPGLCESW